MNKYLQKIAEQAEYGDEIKHDWKPAIVGGAIDIPAGAAIGAAGMYASKKLLKGKVPWLTTGLISGATTAAAADMLQRRAENKQRELLKKANETPERKHTPGVGRHNRMPDSAFRARELALGREIEHEHVDSYQAAEDIAKDHLSELPDYYSKLKKMEKSANKMEKAVRAYHKHKDDAEDVSSEAANQYYQHKKKKKHKS